MPFLVGIGCVKLLGCTAETPAPPPPPSVLLVVLDTVRADHLSSYGYQRDTSKQLSAIADAGITYTDVTAQSPWTWPSHGSLFTGTYPWEHGAHRTSGSDGIGIEESDWSVSLLNPELTTVAEVFKEAGYQTKAFSTNDLLNTELGMMRGFEEVKATGDEQETMRLALEALSAPSDQPLFLFVNLLTAHAPYLVADFVPWSAPHKELFTAQNKNTSWASPYLFKEYPGLDLSIYQPNGLNGEQLFTKGALELQAAELQTIKDLYDGELVRLDLILRSLIEAWNRQHSSGIVAVTSDHGEYLGEHNRIGHGASLHPEVLSVPLVLAHPGQLAPATITTPVELRSLGSTLLHLAKIKTTGPLSSNLLPLTETESEPLIQAGVWGFDEWGPVSNTYTTQRRWLRKGDWQAVIDEHKNIELYRADDPELKENLAKEHPETAVSFLKLAEPTFVESTSPPPTEAQQKALKEQLKALGYMEE